MTALPGGKQWTAIVLTCQTEETAQAFQHELKVRQSKGLLDPNVIVLAVEDPKTQVGSGGATLNALLVVVEHISARQGYTVVNSDVLEDAHVLIIHMGRWFPLDPCGRAFTCLPLTTTTSAAGLVTNLDVLLNTLSSKIAAHSPPGVWICSSDMLLNIPSTYTGPYCEPTEACVVAVPSNVMYARKHGVYKLSKEGIVRDIFYQGSPEEIQSCCWPGKVESVPLVSGVVFLGSQIAVTLLSFHVLPPLDCCTYLGLDSGSSPIQLSLFFDIMLAMCADVSKSSFVSGKRAGFCGKAAQIQSEEQRTVCTARELIWRELHGVKVRTILIRDGSHHYMDLHPQTYHSQLMNLPLQTSTFTAETCLHSHIAPAMTCQTVSAVLINTVLGAGVQLGQASVAAHCHIEGSLKVGDGCMLSGLSMPDETSSCAIGDNLVLLEYRISLPVLHKGTNQQIRVAFGRLDDLSAASDISTFCGQKWAEFYARTGISESELWDSALSVGRRCLLNARLYPLFHASKVMDWDMLFWLTESDNQASKNYLSRWKASWRLSLEEILSLVDVAAEFKWRRDLFYQVTSRLLVTTMMQFENKGWNATYHSAAVDGYSHNLLMTLDKIATECRQAGIAARTLANIADVLGNMAGMKGGLRSGPAGNRSWATAFALLEKGQIADGVKALAAEREHWLSRPDHLVRAARHYEGAAQILIRHAVKSAIQFCKVVPSPSKPVNEWVCYKCSARIDIAGGWSDTPPITYEHGGAVINAAILIDGKRPVGARARRIPELHIVLQLGRESQGSNRIVLNELEQFADHCQPHAPGALLKTALICAQIVDFPSKSSLKDQLRQRHQGGFELHTWSDLPHGSGLGTSSILAGTIMAALLSASGKSIDNMSLIHSVLYVEQMLTTGGGWQDQVGGLIGGIKIGFSEGKLPLEVKVNHLPRVTQETRQAFSDRLVLVYTGRTRLARNLLQRTPLQNVVRNWYARNPDIVDTEDQLVQNAWRCAKAFEKGDLEAVGNCMSTYWEQKKQMAPGCEPLSVRRMMDALRPHTLGMSLAGAGGGGFLYILTREPESVELVRNVLAGVQGIEGVTVHTCSVSAAGLQLLLEDEV